MLDCFFRNEINIPTLLKISEGKLDRLGKYLKEQSFKNISLFYSEGIDKIFGEQVEQSLRKNQIGVIHKESINNTDIENVMKTAFNIPKKTDVLLGIGGGKALDYSKYCAHVLSIPFISVPTSLSNDGFCSPVASLTSNNKRKTIKAQVPYGVIIDLNAIKTSPESCLFSGIGDLVSKITAGYDWKEASIIGNDTFNDFAYLISQNTIIDVIEYQKANQIINVTQTEFLKRLATSLLMDGISMEIAGSSRPASGSEHLISHALDRISEKPQMHGLQVGMATYLCSYLQNNQHDVVKNFLNDTGFFKFVETKPLSKKEFIEAVKFAPTIKENFHTVLSDKININKAIDFIKKDNIMIKSLN